MGNGEPENVKLPTNPNLNPISVGNFIPCFVPHARYPEVTSLEIYITVKVPKHLRTVCRYNMTVKKGFILKNIHSWNISHEKHELVNELKIASV